MQEVKFSFLNLSNAQAGRHNSNCLKHIFTVVFKEKSVKVQRKSMKCFYAINGPKIGMNKCFYVNCGIDF